MSLLATCCFLKSLVFMAFSYFIWYLWACTQGRGKKTKTKFVSFKVDTCTYIHSFQARDKTLYWALNRVKQAMRYKHLLHTSQVIEIDLYFAYNQFLQPFFLIQSDIILVQKIHVRTVPVSVVPLQSTLTSNFKKQAKRR